jgi:hypothetical protein
MSKKSVTLGGDRVGSGKKIKINAPHFERSTHDLGFIWRSTMSAGTLVPFLCQVGLPEDVFDIDLNVDIKTHPTLGPLFASFKVQLDVFKADFRLYQGQLHNNKLGIGMDMSKVKLPQILMRANDPKRKVDIDNEQIDPSSIFSHLNIRGLGSDSTEQGLNPIITREFNACYWLMYWDVFKHYYANKQEKNAYVIHNNLIGSQTVITAFHFLWDGVNVGTQMNAEGLEPAPPTVNYTASTGLSKIRIYCDQINYNDLDNIYLRLVTFENVVPLTDHWSNFEWNDEGYWEGEYIGYYTQANGYLHGYIFDVESNIEEDSEPQLQAFELDKIDEIRETLLKHLDPEPYIIDRDTTLEPLKFALLDKFIDDENPLEGLICSKNFSQEGLAVKTYQSDINNNWMDTEWLDGDNGINAITSIDTTSGSIEINEISLMTKVWAMLNQIAISGGSYDDWLLAVHSSERIKSPESPMYMGGLSKELTFSEVVSNANAGEQPLGTLAGRGTLTSKHKGGKLKIKCNEHCMIMGIISLTPRVDYSQGNQWDVNLKTMNDFHKPHLDRIGFQDLITDKLAWFDTTFDDEGRMIFKSAGKQPAWIDYMSNVNKSRGNFAKQSDQMFMTNNRRYENSLENITTTAIGDLTTYIDPVKYNHIFAYTRRDAQNFWAQVKIDMIKRTQMSAKVMPK